MIANKKNFYVFLKRYYNFSKNSSTLNELKYLNVLLYTLISLTSLIYSKFSFEISKYFDLLKLWCFKNYKLNKKVY